MTERFIDVAVVARRLNVDPVTVRKWIRDGKLAAIQLPSGYWKIPLSELDRLTNPHKVEP